MVVEVMLHAVYLLVGLMSLTGNEDHVSLLRHHAGSADSLLTVNDGDDLLLLQVA